MVMLPDRVLLMCANKDLPCTIKRSFTGPANGTKT